jgi:hypothetical protein
VPDGSQKFESESKGEIADAKKIRLEARESLKAQAGKKCFTIMVERSPQQVLGQISK